MSGRERFVFISHANDDKELIRPVVEGLMRRGEKIWLDNPGKLGFSDHEIRSHFFRLRAGETWLRDGIGNALKRAGCVLFLASERFLEPRRRVWRTEVSRADPDTLVCVHLEKPFRLGASELTPAGLEDEQFASLERDAPGASSYETRLALLLDDVQRKLDRTTQAPVRTGSGQPGELRTPLGPYLIDRRLQETSFEDGLRTVKEAGGVRAFVIAGPENEGIEAFRVRLQRSVSPAVLDDASWEEIRVDWPVQTDVRAFGEEYLDNLRRELAGRKRIFGQADEKAVAGALADVQRPVAVISRVGPEDWRAQEAGRIRAWLRFWGRLQGESGLKALPILWIPLPEARPGWKRHFNVMQDRGLRECPDGRAPGGFANRAIWKSVLDVGQRPQGRFPFRNAAPCAPLTLTPVLHPVRQADIADWMDRIAPGGGIDSDWAPRVEAAAKEVFATGGARKRGVAFNDFVAAVRPHFRTA